jgi:hypothetical protein
MAQKPNPRLAALVEVTESSIAKLRRYTTAVTGKEMQWTPSGINNSLAWLVRHCADLLWLGYGRVSGERVPANLGASGIAWSAVQGTPFDADAREPGPEAQDRVAYLDRAWQKLKAYLEEHPGWEEVEVVVERRRQTGWALLQHNLGDLCYHTGQASYLRKLLAAERKRARGKRQRAGKTP